MFLSYLKHSNLSIDTFIATGKSEDGHPVDIEEKISNNELSFTIV